MSSKPSKLPELEKARGTCQQCIHWNDGECRRYPPQVVVGEDERGQQGAIALWPMTDADEWCGEFRGNN